MIRSSCIVFLSIIALFLTYQVGLSEPHDVQQGPLCLDWGILVSIQAGGRTDQEQPCQAGLGVLVSERLDVSQQHALAAQKSHSILWSFST